MSNTKITGSIKRGKGFRRTSSLLQSRIKAVGSKRGFAVSRLLTHWTEVVGQELARSTQPVDVSYGRKGIGATLTLLVKGAEAPLIEMQKERIRKTVNACYGYNAIQTIRLTQTSAVGFGEAHPTENSAEPQPSQQTKDAAAMVVAPVEDPTLRAALEVLGSRVISPDKH